jgi:hypothetical protein
MIPIGVARRTLVVTALLLASLVAGPAGPAGAPAPVSAATWNGRYSVWRGNAFAPQYLDASCVGATIQIMLNLIDNRRDRSKGRQLEYLAYAQRQSRYEITDDGADPEGWAAAMRHFGGGDDYGWASDTTIQAALRRAATQMRQTGKPVGLLVHFGRHAWVMTGFESTADPETTTDFDVTAAEVVGPLWPDGRLNGQKFDPGPGTWQDVGTLSRKFDAYVVPNQPIWAGQYVTIVPRASDAQPGSAPSSQLPDLNSALGWIWVFDRLAQRAPVRDMLWLP